MLSFELPITPPTATAQQKKHYYNKNLGRVATYKPKNVISAENLLMTALYPHKPASPLGGALSVSIVFYFPFRKTEKKSIPTKKPTQPLSEKSEEQVELPQEEIEAKPAEAVRIDSV